MINTHRILATVALLISVTAHLSAEIITATATIEAVDVDARTVIVRRNTSKGAKTARLRMKTSAQIAGGSGDPIEVGALAQGDQIELTYDTTAKSITKIKVLSAAHDHDATSASGVPLFNGDDLEGWRFMTAPKLKAELQFAECWGADAQRHVLFATGKGHTWLETAEKYDNFVLSLDWRMVPGAPSSPNGGGVVIRAVGVHSWGIDPRGIQVDLSDEHTGAFICYGTPLANGKKSAVGEGTQKLDAMSTPSLKGPAQWNSMQIRCDGSRVAVSVNGKKVNEGTGTRVKKGNICLRSQASAIEYRNIRLAPITPR